MMTTKEFKLLHSNYYDCLPLATTAMATDSVTQFVPSLSTFVGTGLDAHIVNQGLFDHAAGSSALHVSDCRRGGFKIVARVGDTEFNLEIAFSEKFDFKRPSQGWLSKSLQLKNYDYEAVIITCNIHMLRQIRC